MHAVIFDCEQLTDMASPTRFWCGPDDPDPLLVQIGAVRVSLKPPFDIVEGFEVLVRPVGRNGPVAPPAFFTGLTGIDADRIEREGTGLACALQRFADLVGDAPVYSWGKDEITAFAPSCFIAGIVSPLPASRFGNAADLLREVGVPLDDIHRLRSHTLPQYFGLAAEGSAHDGQADARGVARVLQHLLRDGRLTADRVGRRPG